MNPLTGLYGAATALHSSLFDWGLLRARHLAEPVVSVGNLSAGGTGKTPLVMALGELLKAKGVSFDVLSRGYRRKTRGVLVVDPDGGPSDFGDEPLLIARRLQVPVIIGESRYEAGRIAEQRFRSQLHLLDDGFQHRSLERDFDIVLMTAEDFDDRLLPSGRLREPLASLRRADAVVLPHGIVSENPALHGKLVWHMKREMIVDSVPASPVAFCGIARPAQFFAQLRAAKIIPAEEVVFRDHHSYNESDIERLLARQRELGAGGFVTTEKDAINLGPLQARFGALAIAGLKITIERPDAVLDAILTRIADRKPRS